MSDLVSGENGLAQLLRIGRVHPYVRTALTALLVSAGYYVGALIAYKLRFPSLRISVIWPPNAVLLVALLLTPARTWWVWLLAAFAAHFVGATQHGTPVGTFVIYYVGNAIEAVIAAFGVRRFSNSPHRFDNLWSMAVLIGFAGIIAPGVTSLLVAYLLTLSGWPVDYWFVWLARSLADAFPNLVLVPLILLTVADGIVTVWERPLRYAELGLLMVGLFAVGIPVFGWEVAGPGRSPALLYAPLPLLLWAAVRFGLAGVCLSLLLVALLSLSNAIAGRGPFITQLPAENAISLQFFLTAISCPLMLLAALVQERWDKTEALVWSEAALRASYEQIQNLVGRLITAQEAERRRIARELHDDINQQLASLSIAFSGLKRRLAADGADVHDALDQLQQRTITLAEAVRHLSHDLHPGVLQHAGLVAALEAHCAEVGSQHAIEVTFSAAAGFETIPQDMALCLYRVAQEALRNIAVHAGARQARVALKLIADGVELTIADDGQGFDLTEAQRRGGLGLISLDERVRLVGGSLQINTQPQRGTELRVQVPLRGRDYAPHDNTARR
jgi:signal transduction histidine kinase